METMYDNQYLYDYCANNGMTDSLYCTERQLYMVDNLFIFLTSFLSGMFSSFTLVSYLFKHYRDSKYVGGGGEGDDKSDDDEVDFEYKYYDELNELELREMTKEELDALFSKTVDVETPDGIVKMTYNNKTESFWYYADNKNVHYKYLDSVARYFTIQNNCRQICVNYKEEYEKSVLSIKEQIEEDARKLEESKNDLVPKKKSVFAQFKNYKKDDVKNKKQYVLVDKANQFKHAGTMSDYANELNKKEKKQETVPTLDYATFKRLQMEREQAQQAQAQAQQAQAHAQQAQAQEQIQLHVQELVQTQEQS